MRSLGVLSLADNAVDYFAECLESETTSNSRLSSLVVSPLVLIPDQRLLLSGTSAASGSLPVGDVLTQAEELRKFCLVGAGIEDRAHRFDNLREDRQPLPRARRLLDKGLR